MITNCSIKQIEALKFLQANNRSVCGTLADKNIHWRTQHNLYVKCLVDILGTSSGVLVRITNRGIKQLEEHGKRKNKQK